MSPRPDPALDTYAAAMRVADPDAVHDAYVARGQDILGEGIPYLVRAARWLAASHRRRDARREALAASEADHTLGAQTLVGWDPFERVARNEVLSRVLGALAAMGDQDVLVVWATCEGRTDDEIIAAWNARGFEPKDPTQDAIRQRRHRALAKLKARLAEPA